tara:strand:- start:6993 stop:7427 length:435 start_codon:yes stop_codon:yes gene_type:complete
LKELYNRILYVEDALLERLKKDPSNGLGRDLLFIRFFRIYFSQKVEPNADNWYPIQAEDYVTWQIKQFHKLKKNKNYGLSLRKGIGYNIDYAQLEMNLDWIVNKQDWRKLVSEINTIWKNWGLHKEYIIPSYAVYESDLKKWRV